MFGLCASFCLGFLHPFVYTFGTSRCRFLNSHRMIPCNNNFFSHILLNAWDSWAWYSYFLKIHFCFVPLPFAFENPWTEFDTSPISVCHLSEELLVIVKECFPTLILRLSPSAKWADFGLTHIFDKDVPGEWGGSVKNFYLLTFAWIRLWFCFSNVQWKYFLSNILD